MNHNIMNEMDEDDESEYLDMSDWDERQDYFLPWDEVRREFFLNPILPGGDETNSKRIWF